MLEVGNVCYVVHDDALCRLEGGNIRVERPDEPPRRLPLALLDGITVFGRATVTSDLLSACADAGIQVDWLTSTGRLRARVVPATRGGIVTRLRQYDAYSTEEIRLGLAQTFISAKISNARHVLLRWARDARDETAASALRKAATAHEKALTALNTVPSVSSLLGVEGAAASAYFTALPYALKKDSWEFLGRSRRPPRDPVNCLLSFAYALITGACVGACNHALLDPELGFVHEILPTRPALALDLLEEFRAPLADRWVITQINDGHFRLTDLKKEPVGGSWSLTEAGLKNFLSLWHTHWRKLTPHPSRSAAVYVGTLPLVQARHMASVLQTRTPDSYIPYKCGPL